MSSAASAGRRAPLYLRRPWALVCALLLADVLMFGAVAGLAFPPARVSPSPRAVLATFTPNPAFTRRLITPTSTPLLLPTPADTFPYLIPSGERLGARRAHGRTPY